MNDYRELIIEAPAGAEDELTGHLFAGGARAARPRPPRRPDPPARLLRRRRRGSARAARRPVRCAGGRPAGRRCAGAAVRLAGGPGALGGADRGRGALPRRPARAGGGRSTGAPRGDGFLLRLPARTAFGVGSHESTRLDARAARVDSGGRAAGARRRLRNRNPRLRRAAYSAPARSSPATSIRRLRCCCRPTRSSTGHDSPPSPGPWRRSRPGASTSRW